MRSAQAGRAGPVSAQRRCCFRGGPRSFCTGLFLLNPLLYLDTFTPAGWELAGEEHVQTLPGRCSKPLHPGSCL